MLQTMKNEKKIQEKSHNCRKEKNAVVLFVVVSEGWLIIFF